MKRTQSLFIGLALIASARVWSFHPSTLISMTPGNEWVYHGRISVQSTVGVSETETLRIKILSKTSSGDSTLFKVSMRDSLSDRVWKGAYSFTGAYEFHPKDTVISEIRTWVQFGNKATGRDTVFIRKETPDKSVVNFPFDSYLPYARYSLFENTPLFADPNCNVWVTTLSGATGGQHILTGNPVRYPGPLGETWNGWILIYKGLYWAKSHADFSASCGPSISRELLLDSFNGKHEDVGLAPPGSVLAKEARIACSIGKRSPRKAYAVGIRSRGAEFNFLGRASEGGRR